MNRKESLALYAKGRDAWNAWAEKRLDERVALEAAHTWVESLEESDWNDETRAWHAKAAADFSKFRFSERYDFSDFVFPGGAEFGEAIFVLDALFNRTTFTGNASFAEATFHRDAEFHRTTFTDSAKFDKAVFTRDAWFEGATFTGVAWFEWAIFTSHAKFEGAIFTGGAWFSRAAFTEDAVFSNATFTDSAWFGKATFSGIARFSGAAFTEEAVFSNATFSGIVRFGEATFTGKVWFAQAIFEAYTVFDDAKFKCSAHFSAIEAKSGFSLAGATFFEVPDFIQAHFAEAPRLDDSRIGPLGFWQLFLTRIKENFSGDPDLAARWRALKRLAIQGHDHSREQAFFKGELKARRWSEDKPWHAVFWFGVFYQLLSDFGRSIWRPLMWWVASVLGFAGLYLTRHPVLAKESSPVISAFQRLIGVSGDVPPLTCVAGPGEPLWSALLMSVQKGLLFPGLIQTNKLNQIYACLYGIHSDDGKQPSQLPESFSPEISDGVTALGFLQYPLSAALIFLFLLAIRNHFRIK